jgi:predicted ATPase/class 3 adenylate cyclase/phage tail protein X
MPTSIFTSIEKLPPPGVAVPSLAFLFTDIEGSTALWERHASAMGEAIARHDALIAAGVAASGGALIKTTGDGAYAVFPTVGQALAAALAIQRGCTEAVFDAIGGLRVRMAVHVGPAEQRDEDYFGPTLNRASRIMGIGHGGQVLVSDAAAAAGEAALAATGLALRRLGAHRLRDLSSPETIYQLVGPGLAGMFPPLRSLDVRPHNLPVQLTSFIGRDVELVEIAKLMDRHRLVTVLGPGGNGKTRFALHAAAEILDRYPDGVWFVELGGATETVQVAEQVASVLGITLAAGGIAVDQLASALRGQTMLIILDNCEHLIEGVAKLAATLLGRSQTVAVLATSRSVLGMVGECAFALAPLGLPEASASLTVGTAMDHAAIRLFVERAALVSSSGVLDDTSVQDIATICRRLDGVALAIELAAARIRMLTPRELLARLDDRFRILTGGSRMSLPRQQTLRALIDWSFSLLTPLEQAAFRRLGVFAGSFDLASAEAVIAGDGIDQLDVFDLVSSLQDKSLVMRLPSIGGAASRFRLLESARHYALAALAEVGEASAMRLSLAKRMIVVFGAARDRWPDTNAETWFAALEPEIENYRAALAWSFELGRDPHNAIALAARIPFRGRLMPQREVFSILKRAVDHLTAQTPLSDAAWLWYYFGYDYSSGYPAAAMAAQKSHALFDRIGDRAMTAVTAIQAAFLMVKPGVLAAVQPYLDVAIALLPDIPPNRNRARVLGQLGATYAIAAGHDRYIQARIYMKEELTIAQTFDDYSLILFNSINLVEIEARFENYREAIETLAINIEMVRVRRDPVQLGESLQNLASYSLLNDDLAGARRAGREAMTLFAEQEQRYHVALLAGTLALLAAREARWQIAATLAGFCDGFLVTAAQVREDIEQRIWDALTREFADSVAAGDLPDAERVRLMAEGATLTLEAVLALALTL